MSLFRPYKYSKKMDLEKDAPRKHSFFIFWEIVIRKIWRLITMNLIYFVITLPMLLWAFFTLNGFLVSYFGEEIYNESFLSLFLGIEYYATLIAYVPTYLYYPLLILSVVLYGPATMGMTYMLRNFSREEHAWSSDFFTRALSNFKQGLFFGLLDVVVIVFLVNNIIGNFTASSDAMGIVLLVAKYISIPLLVIYMFMRHYFYMIAVTVDLSVIAILKNSWLFVVLGFFRNLWVAVINIIIWVVCLFTIQFISFITLPLILYSFTGFITVYCCYPVVKKYLIMPILEKEAEKGQEAPSSSELMENGNERATPED